MIRVGVDVGGTFTDLVALDGVRVVTAKVPSTPDDQSEGVMRGARGRRRRGDVAAFAHGMTVATNALLERRGARTALVTTEGFRDLIEIARQDRPSLYDLAERRARAARAARPALHRARADGARRRARAARRRTSCATAVDALREAEVEAVAVCLLFAFLHPEHEQRVGEAVREALATSTSRSPARCCRSSASTSASRPRSPTPTSRRSSAPTSSAWPARAERGRRAGAAGHAVLRRRGRRRGRRRAGGRLRALRARPAASSARRTSRGASGYEDVLTFDMGGTSTDVAPIVGGEASTTTESVVAGRADQAADGRRPHGQRRRRLDRLGRPRRRAARRPALGGRRARSGRLRQGRRGADGDRRQPAARLPRRRRRARRRADALAATRRSRRWRRSATSSGSTRSRPRSASCASPTPRWSARCG